MKIAFTGITGNVGQEVLKEVMKLEGVEKVKLLVLPDDKRIKKLQKEGKFNSLPDNLKELANLRIENPEASLTELGQMLEEPIGKSGVNYRLNTIIKMAL